MSSTHQTSKNDNQSDSKASATQIETPGPIQEPRAPGAILPQAHANPDTLTPPDVLQLQRAGGNRAVSQMFSGEQATAIQPKLTLGPVNDKYEQEADNVAKQVVNAAPVRQPSTSSTDNSTPVRRVEEDEIRQKPAGGLLQRIGQRIQRMVGSLVQRTPSGEASTGPSRQSAYVLPTIQPANANVIQRDPPTTGDSQSTETAPEQPAPATPSTETTAEQPAPTAESQTESDEAEAGEAESPNVQLPGISTPQPPGTQVNDSGSASRTINGVEVVFLPDATSTDESLQDGAVTRGDGQINGGSRSWDGNDVITQFDPPTVTFTIQTTYGPGANATSDSEYGRGTTQEDQAAGNTSLGFHEGSHGLDYVEYMETHPLPQFGGTVGMTRDEFEAAEQQYATEMTEYFEELQQASHRDTDCVGTTIDDANGTNECAVHEEEEQGNAAPTEQPAPVQPKRDHDTSSAINGHGTYTLPTAQPINANIIQPKSDSNTSGSGIASGVESAIQGARGGGRPLDEGVRGSMEQAFGADFSGVRVHTGAESDRLNHSIQAKAFTTGNDIFFGRGEYNPGSRSGKELLAHELTHTIQQTGGVQAKRIGQPADQRNKTAGQVVKQAASQQAIQRTPEEERNRRGGARARERHERDRGVLIRAVEGGLARGRDRRLQNSCAWIRSGRAKLFAVTKTHDSRRRARAANRPAGEAAYFPRAASANGPGHIYARSIAMYNPLNVNDNTNVVFEDSNTLGWNTPNVIAVVNARQQSQRALWETIRHEVQHDADRNWDAHPRSGSVEDNLNGYKTEYRAYSYEGGDFDRLSNTRQVRRHGYTWTQKQLAIFRHIWDDYDYVQDAWGKRNGRPVSAGGSIGQGDNAQRRRDRTRFQQAVVAYVNPDTEGYNAMNSVRVDDFYQALRRVPRGTSQTNNRRVTALAETISHLQASEANYIQNHAGHTRMMRQRLRGEALEHIWNLLHERIGPIPDEQVVGRRPGSRASGGRSRATAQRKPDATIQRTPESHTTHGTYTLPTIQPANSNTIQRHGDGDHGHTASHTTPAISIRSPVFEQTVTQISSVAGSLAGRALTSREIALAQPVFGESIDFDRVRIVSADALEYRTVGNVIYLPSDFTIRDEEMAQTLIHELTHVWQYQHGGAGYISTALQTQAEAAITEGHRNMAYEYNPDPSQTFFDFTPEQQGSIVENYFAMQRDQSAGEEVTQFQSNHFDPETGFRRRMNREERMSEIATELPIHETYIGQMRQSMPQPDLTQLMSYASDLMTTPGADLMGGPDLSGSPESGIVPLNPILRIDFNIPGM